MPDITAITGVLTGIKTATDIAKSIKDADLSLEKAELKLQIAELVSALADSKISIADIQSVLQEKDDEIERLKNALDLKKKLIRHEGFYYEMNEEGAPIGEAYCSHCFEARGLAIHVVQHPKQRAEANCPSCKTNSRYPFPIE